MERHHYNLLTNVARGEWGFEGIFITDYLGSMDSVEIDKMLAIVAVFFVKYFPLLQKAFLI